MSLSLRRRLARTRRDIRVRMFGNSNSEIVNFRYWRYRRYCQILSGAKIAEYGKLPTVRASKTDGFSVAGPPAGMAEGDRLAVKQKVDALFDAQRGGYQVAEGLYRLVDGFESVPEIVDAIDEDLERVLLGYFGSLFKIYSVSFYRTVPTERPPQSSFLWHVDNVPTGEIKLMIYLDDVRADTGAFRIKRRPTTQELFPKGYRDRWRFADAADEVEDELTTETIEGGAMTRILFENGACLHKATFPEHSHRDVASFVIIPSDMDWRVCLARNRHLLSTNAGICKNPYTNSPEKVGYQF